MAPIVSKIAAGVFLLAALLPPRSTTALMEETCEPSSSTSCAPSLNQDAGKHIRTTKLSELFDIACKTDLAACDMAYLDIDDETRTVRAKTGIKKMHGLIEASVDLQLTFLEALRDERVQHVFQQHPKIVHKDNEEHYLLAHNYMALFLSFEFHRLNDEGVAWEYASAKDKVRRAYVNYLPTLEDYSNHPTYKAIFGEPREQKEYEVKPFIDQRTDLVARDILAAYDLFCNASSEFDKNVSLESFVRASIAVGSRTFTRKLTKDDVDDQELNKYVPFLRHGKNSIGAVMIPLIDSFNHHSVNSNIQWRDRIDSDCSDDSRSFTVYSSHDIGAGDPLLVSYGRHPEQYFYSIYGFVVPDRSDDQIVSLASAHHLFESIQDGERHQFYLNYWDGYNECPITVHASAKNVAENKQIDVYNAKIKALKALSTENWILSMDANGKPEITDKILTTCRIIAVTHRDYDGWATALLEKIATTPDFQHLRPSKNIELEYRAYHVLERLAKTSINTLRKQLKPFATNSYDEDNDEDPVELEIEENLNNGNFDPWSPDGQRSYIFVREIEILKDVVAIAQAKKDSILGDGITVIKQKQFVQNDANSYAESSISEDFSVRDTFCIPKEKFKIETRPRLG